MIVSMPNNVPFAADLYSGTAEFYDRYRLSYAPALIDHLVNRVQPAEQGRVLDLACGTGQLAFALADHFDDVWAVDQEPGQIALVQDKINSLGARTFHPMISSVEKLSLPPATFDLIVIGNAFHRLPRELVAGRAYEWLRPGGHLALLWSTSPWFGQDDWQTVFRQILDDWQEELEVRDRVPSPAAVDTDRELRPDEAILTAAGFYSVERSEVELDHRWTVIELAGFVYSTSFLAAPLFGDRAAEFEADLQRRLQPYTRDGTLVDQVSYAYDLYLRPDVNPSDRC